MTETSLKDVVAKVKKAYDLSEYVQDSGIVLTVSGTNRFKGLCPFHVEKTASFVIDTGFQNYRCFGCGANGDIISFVQFQDNVEFIEALEKLADSKGIEIPSKFSDREDGVDYKTLRACVFEAAKFFVKSFNSLDDSHLAKREIANRGLSLRGGVRFGYAPEGGSKLYKHLQSAGFSDEIILLAGVVSKAKDGRLFDFWRGRLMFIVGDATGKPIAFSGRKLFETDTMGKYVNSPETPLYTKSNSLFNLYMAKSEAKNVGEVYVAEGQFDVAALVESGFRNTVASLGTSFTLDQGLMCRRMVGEKGKIVFCFDGDNAGVEAVKKIFTNVPAIHSQSYVVLFPEKSDPCSFYEEKGGGELERYIKSNQVQLVEFIIDDLLSKYDMFDSTDVDAFIDEVAKVLKVINSFTFRELMIKKVALASMVSPDAIKKAISKAKDKQKVSHQSQKAVIESDKPELADDSDELDADKLLHKIETNVTYETLVRLAALVLHDRSFVESFLELADKAPVDMKWVFEDFAKLKNDDNIVAEDFSLLVVAQKFSSIDLFPYLSAMNSFEIGELFEYLKKTYLDSVRRKSDLRLKKRLADVLKGAQGKASIEILEQVMQKLDSLKS